MCTIQKGLLKIIKFKKREAIKVQLNYYSLKMASGDVINSIEEYDLKDLGTKKKQSTIDCSSYGKIYTPLKI